VSYCCGSWSEAGANLFDRHVAKALKALMKDVQADEEVGEDELEEMV
jgi:hypothetical protein